MSEDVRDVAGAGAEVEVADGVPAVATRAPAGAGGASLVDEEDVWEALRDVIDPELGINVVDLGLVYAVTIGSDGVATVDMTLTSAACPLTDLIETQAAAAVEGLVEGLAIQWVWSPPWGPGRITEDGRAQLRAIGFNV
jgi:metal-sulfur cluster biosynthetic enzyme